MTDEEAQCAILTGAQDYLRDEHHWLRDGRYSTGKTSDGADPATVDLVEGPIESVFPPDAQVCTIGAMYLAARQIENLETWRMRDLVGRMAAGLMQRAIGKWVPPDRAMPTSIPVWNDRVATHEWLMEAFDTARAEVCE